MGKIGSVSPGVSVPGENEFMVHLLCVEKPCSPPAAPPPPQSRASGDPGCSLSSPHGWWLCFRASGWAEVTTGGAEAPRDLRAEFRHSSSTCSPTQDDDDNDDDSDTSCREGGILSPLSQLRNPSGVPLTPHVGVGVFLTGLLGVQRLPWVLWLWRGGGCVLLGHPHMAGMKTLTLGQMPLLPQRVS